MKSEFEDQNKKEEKKDKRKGAKVRVQNQNGKC